MSPQPETQAFLLPKPHTPVPEGERGSWGWLPRPGWATRLRAESPGHLSLGRMSDHTHAPWTFIPTASSTPCLPLAHPNAHTRMHTQHPGTWPVPKRSVFLGTGSGRGLDTLLGQLPQPLTHACPNPPHHPFKMQV